jgi:glutathione S-transferase
VSMTLVIGTRKWSSWSLRPWIALKQIGLPFQEVTIPLRQPDTRARILEYSPAGRVPILIDGAVVVWESLAILDHLADRFPTRGLWPSEPVARGHARAISAEMHACFAALRRELPMDISAEQPTPELSADAAADVARVQAIWRHARQRFGGAGSFLFGRFTNADAMFAPVATRFRTYGIELDPVCRSYVDTVLNLPAMVAWYRAAAAETDLE